MRIAAIERKNLEELRAWYGAAKNEAELTQALREATIKNWPKGVEYLMARLPADQATITRITSPASLEALKARNIDLALLFAGKGSDPSATCTEGDWKNYNALQMAVYLNYKNVIQTYLRVSEPLKLRAALAFSGELSLTPFMMAVDYRYTDISLLLASRDSLDHVCTKGSWNGYNALQMAVYRNDTAAIKAYLEARHFTNIDAVVGFRGSLGLSSFMMAIDSSYFELSRLLASKTNPGLLCTEGSWKGYNALQMAVYRNDAKSVAALLHGDLSSIDRALSYTGTAVHNAFTLAVLYKGREVAEQLAAHLDPTLQCTTGAWKDYNMLQMACYLKWESTILAFERHASFGEALRAEIPGTGNAYKIATTVGLSTPLRRFLDPRNGAGLRHQEIMTIVRHPDEASPRTFLEALAKITAEDSYARSSFGERNWLYFLAKLRYHPEISEELVQRATKKVLSFHHPYTRVAGKSLFLSLTDYDPYELSSLMRPSAFLGVEGQVSSMQIFLQTVLDKPFNENHFLLLSGPPGTGKTELATEVATAKGFTLTPYVRGDRDDMFIGGIETRVQKFFAEAKAARTPVALFIDEIDAILPDSPEIPSSGFNYDKIVTLFQTEIDQLKGHKIVLMGATNYLDRLKPAIRRRAGTSIMFTLPALSVRERIISDLLRLVKLEVGSDIISRLAKATPAWSPAHLKKFIETVIEKNRLTANISPLPDSCFEMCFEETRKELELVRPGEIAMIAPKLRVPAGAGSLVALDDELQKTKDLICAFIANPSLFLPVIPSYNVNTLLYGKPGTGKTALARAVVEQSNCTCFIVDPSKPGGFREVFTRAKSCERAIIFIDEFDRFAAFSGLIQAEMDGFVKEGGKIVVIAATNFLDRIEEAVLSRFNIQVEVMLPNFERRKLLFTTFLTEIRSRDASLFDEAFNSEIQSGCPHLAAQSDGLSIRDIKSVIDKAVGFEITRRSNLSSTTGGAGATAHPPSLLAQLLTNLAKFVAEQEAAARRHSSTYPGFFPFGKGTAAHEESARAGAGADYGWATRASGMH